MSTENEYKEEQFEDMNIAHAGTKEQPGDTKGPDNIHSSEAKSEDKPVDPLYDIAFFHVEKDSLDMVSDALKLISNEAERYIMRNSIDSMLKPVTKASVAEAEKKMK